MHKILAMVAIVTVSTLTTGSQAAHAALGHTLSDVRQARPVVTNPGHLYYLARRSANARLEVASASMLRLSGAALTTLARPGAFNELRHPWHNLVRRPRIEARARAAAAAIPPAGSSGAVAAAHLSATGYMGCVMHAESDGVSTAWYPGHTDGSLPGPYNPVAEGLFGFLLSTWQGLGLGWPQGASYAPAKVQIKGFWKLYDSQGTAPWSSDGCAGGSTASVSATPLVMLASMLHRHRHHHDRRDHARWARWIMGKALAWALTQAGKPYEWGETGPYGYDCSGLVYAAYRHIRKIIPRDTFGMLASLGGRLRVVHGKPKRGDLAFFGSGHVELLLNFRKHLTFGAEAPGTDVGRHRWSVYWHPTLYVAFF